MRNIWPVREARLNSIAHCGMRGAPADTHMLYWQDSKLGAVLIGRHGAIIDAFRGPLRRRSSRLYAFVETSTVLALDGDHQMTCANDILAIDDSRAHPLALDWFCRGFNHSLQPARIRL